MKHRTSSPAVRAVLVPLLLTPLLLLASCVTGSWEREHRFMRPPPGSIPSLEPGVDDLERCLDSLGAPLFVYETPQGFAVAYGWFESRDLGGSVRVPVSDSASASLRLLDVDDRMQGLVLFFGPQAGLRLVKRGPLRDLTAGTERIRPVFVDDTED